ncbi:MAG TPA: PAS domain S-box protein [Mucilaginibacter sp.]|nr:PAS domain S-box protein [Mucilaginibacter sp.]
MNKNQALFPDDEFRRMANSLPLLVQAVSTDGACSFLNTAWLALIGEDKKEACQAWEEGVHPDDLRQNRGILSDSLDSRKEFKRLYRIKRYDGLYRWIAEKFVPQYLADNTFAGYAAYGLDIGDQLEDPKLRDDLFELEARHRQNSDEELASTNEELTATNEELVVANEELRQTQESLAELNRELEDIVAVRTKSLWESEQKAQTLNEELAATNEELAATNEELATTNEELRATNEELIESREEILKRERLFKSIALNIPKSVVVVIGKDHRFLAVEGDLMTKMGYDSRDYVGKHPTEVAPLERYEASKHLYDRVLQGKQFTVDRKGPTGEDYRVEFVPLRNDQQEVYAALIVALDITDIRQAEEQSAKLAAIVTSSDDAIISKTLQGVVTSWNKSAERIFGYTEKEMVGQSILKIIPPDRVDEEPRILERLRKGERVDHFETKRMTKDGRLLDISLTISPVRDSEGHIIGASKIARDISEKKLDEQKKNDFIGMVSHELKTPLTSLTAIVQLLQARLGQSDDSFLADSLKKANKQVKKMADMINGFLNISRLESGKMPIMKKEFELGALIKDAIDETRFMIGNHEFKFNNGQPIHIYADRDKIGSVVLNLLNNAVKYSPKSRTIEVDCVVIDSRVQVSVKDEGIGIKAADRDRLFERYYRVEDEQTRHISGFGIGLYLSAEIVKQHGGKIWAESEPGKGSTFYFTLPLK